MTPEVFTRRQQVELLGKLGPRNMKDMSMALKVPLTQLLEAPNLCDILTETSLSRQSHRLLAHLVIKRE
jgi:hypothetical protein